MNRAIDAAAEQGVVELLGEKAFAAGFDEAAILDAIAARGDRDDFERVLRRAERSGEPRARLAGLRERKLRAARANAEKRCHALAYASAAARPIARARGALYVEA